MSESVRTSVHFLERENLAMRNERSMRTARFKYVYMTAQVEQAEERYGLECGRGLD